jgi:hypothetical protein
MSWHERVAYVLGSMAGTTIAETRPYWLMAIALIAISAVGAIASIILDETEPFCRN